MLNSEAFDTAVRARLLSLDHPRDTIALAIETIALRSLLDSVTELTDALDALLDGHDTELETPIREVLDAVRDRVTVGMGTIADIIARVRA